MGTFEMPAQLSVELAMQPEAMHKFATLTEKQKWEVVSGTHAISTREEMQRYVANIMNVY